MTPCSLRPHPCQLRRSWTRLQTIGVNPTLLAPQLCPVVAVQAQPLHPSCSPKPLLHAWWNRKKLANSSCASCCIQFAKTPPMSPKQGSSLLACIGMAAWQVCVGTAVSSLTPPQAINQFIAQQLDVAYNAFVVLDNVASPMHRDTMNAPVHNSVGEFTEGGVWTQDPMGLLYAKCKERRQKALYWMCHSLQHCVPRRIFIKQSPGKGIG